jgi:GPH family glycoside/pentoside/hexuronide:cation symporter
VPPLSSSSRFGALDGLRYGLLGLPLAFVALPLYVLLPNHYARAFGVPLATLGAVLLGARLLDALIDPLLGRLSDRLHARSPRAVLGFGAIAASVLLVGFGLLFFPQALVDPARHGALLAATAVLLAVTYAGYSMLSIAHQSWGAMLGGDALQRGRIVGWREGMGLVGVVLASVIPTLAGLPAMVAVFGVALAIGWLLWTRAPRPVRGDARHTVPHALRSTCACRCAGPRFAGCSRCSCSTASPARCRPRWCCSSCRTGCRRRLRCSRPSSASTS